MVRKPGKIPCSGKKAFPNLAGALSDNSAVQFLSKNVSESQAARSGLERYHVLHRQL